MEALAELVADASTTQDGNKVKMRYCVLSKKYPNNSIIRRIREDLNNMVLRELEKSGVTVDLHTSKRRR